MVKKQQIIKGILVLQIHYLVQKKEMGHRFETKILSHCIDKMCLVKYSLRLWLYVLLNFVYIVVEYILPIHYS